MPDLTLDEFAGIPKDRLKKLLAEEKSRLFGADPQQDSQNRLLPEKSTLPRPSSSHLSKSVIDSPHIRPG
jgi:hypothetical protein